MLNTLVLQSFKSFGSRQTVNLQPISVLVGANNSGKSNLMSVCRLIKNVTTSGWQAALHQEGGAELLFHLPPAADVPLHISWTVNQGSYSVTLKAEGDEISAQDETLVHADHGPAWVIEGGTKVRYQQTGYDETVSLTPFAGLKNAVQWLPAFSAIWTPITAVTTVRLVLGALRQDSNVVPAPVLGPDGSGLAAVIGLWRGAEPDRAEALDEFLGRCVPEIKRVLVRPSPADGKQRLWFALRDGTSFDAEHVSDGVLHFTALAAHVFAAEPGATIFIEQPEDAIHPQRILQLVDLLREAVEERGCQFVLSTHSPVLLNAFRDEPEAILLVSRPDKESIVTSLADVPHLVEALTTADPGSMLQNGFFNR